MITLTPAWVPFVCQSTCSTLNIINQEGEASALLQVWGGKEFIMESQ
jgi:hypothetical protein